MPNADYWKKRFLQLEAAQNQKGKNCCNEIEQQYRTSIKSIDKKINEWYGRLAVNNDVTMQDAYKLLDANELKEFKWDVNQYIKALTESGAKNIKAARALLNLDDAALSDDGLVKGLSEQIDKLKADDGSKFLFSEPEQPQTKFTGFQPGSSSMVPNSKQAGYEARLAEARKNGNQLEVINIKQEAFQNDGIALM